MDSIGIKHELDKDEEVVIGDETPALLEIVQEGLFSRKSLLVDITGINEIESVYAMPYLTNKRILLWLLIISKKVGPIGKWWEMPIDFIRGVKFKGEKDSLKGIQIDYAVPTVEKSFGRQVLGMSRGKENFTVIFYTNAFSIISISFSAFSISNLDFSIIGSSLAFLKLKSSFVRLVFQIGSALV